MYIDCAFRTEQGRRILHPLSGDHSRCAYGSAKVAGALHLASLEAAAGMAGAPIRHDDPGISNSPIFLSITLLFGWIVFLDAIKFFLQGLVWSMRTYMPNCFWRHQQLNGKGTLMHIFVFAQAL